MVLTLDDARADVARLRAGTGPERDAQLAQALVKLAGFAMGDALTEPADAALREAITVYRAMLARRPKDVAVCLALTHAIQVSGDLARLERMQAAAQTPYSEALTVAERCVGLAPSNLDAQDAQIVTLCKLADLALLEADRKAGYAFYLRAQTLELNRTQVDSEVFEALAERGIILSRLAHRLGLAKAARDHAESAVRHAQKAVVDPIDAGSLAGLANTRVALGDFLCQVDAYADAQAAYAQAAQERRQLSQIEPGDAFVGFGRVEVEGRLAAVALDQKQDKVAESHLNRGQALADQLSDGNAFEVELKHRARLVVRAQRMRLYGLRGDKAAEASEAAAVRALLPKVRTGGAKGKAMYLLNRLDGPP